MADQFDSNTRSPEPESEVDDPLAELARIIGYERPSEAEPGTGESPESAEFDLEAELMRELDVPLAPSDEELDDVEAEEAVDAMLAETDFDEQLGLELDQELGLAFAQESEPELQSEPELHDGGHESPVDIAPTQDADFLTAEGRSSEALLEAIGTEVPHAQGTTHHGDETGIDDDWMMTLDADEPTPSADVTEFGAAPTDRTGANDAEAEGPSGPVAAAEDAPPADAGHPVNDDVFADMVRFELPDTAQVATAAIETSATSEIKLIDDNPADDAPLDFEEYLSTELDVFGHEVAMESGRDDSGTNEELDEADSAAQLEVETALDALNDSSLDDEVAVFDDAAEELLASINNDGADRASPVPRNLPSNAAEGRWSLDSIEEGAGEELDEELGDMFELPERVVNAAAKNRDVTDDLDLDLDLEQALADSFDETEPGTGPVETVEMLATTLETEQVVEADDWLSASPELEQPVYRDEISEAFLGLAPHADDVVAQSQEQSDQPAAPPSTVPAADVPDQSDWLDGFETSEHDLEPGGSASDDSEYYFDAGLISESDEMVEVVADIDVPELEQDEPQPIDPDYDSEIEREFADIVDRSDTHADEAAAAGVGASFAAAEGWNRGAATAHAHEVSDDYIALERELGDRPGDDGRPSVVEGIDATYPAVDFDFNEEMAAGAGATDDGRSRGPVLAFAVLGLALLAGAGAFGWSMLSGGETTADGGPRIIRADKDPVKVLPENPGGVTVPNQDKAVYDRVAGGTGTSSGQPALVNSAEEPVDVVQRTLDPEILPLEGRSEFSEKSEERLSADGSTAEVVGNDVAAPVVSPRKVRTMIVKPDGSIVAREVAEPEADASVEVTEQNTASAQEQVQVGAQTQSDTQAQPLQSPEPVTQVSADDDTTAGDQQADTEAASTEGTVAPVRVVTTQQIRPVANAPVPQGRPADQPVNVVGTVTQGGTVGAAPAAPATPQPVAVASAPAAAAPAPAAAAPVANPGGYYVQIASQPTVEGAQSSWRTLSSRYSSVLGGQSVDIQRADIPGKGVFHRVRVPAGSRDQATALCSRYKAAGGSCFVSR